MDYASTQFVLNLGIKIPRVSVVVVHFKMAVGASDENAQDGACRLRSCLQWADTGPTLATGGPLSHETGTSPLGKCSVCHNTHRRHIEITRAFCHLTHNRYTYLVDIYQGCACWYA